MSSIKPQWSEISDYFYLNAFYNLLLSEYWLVKIYSSFLTMHNKKWLFAPNRHIIHLWTFSRTFFGNVCLVTNTNVQIIKQRLNVKAKHHIAVLFKFTAGIRNILANMAAMCNIKWVKWETENVSARFWLPRNVIKELLCVSVDEVSWTTQQLFTKSHYTTLSWDFVNNLIVLFANAVKYVVS